MHLNNGGFAYDGFFRYSGVSLYWIFLYPSCFSGNKKKYFSIRGGEKIDDTFEQIRKTILRHVAEH